MTTVLERCPDCRCGGKGWATMAELAPGKYDGDQGEVAATCYCSCHGSEKPAECSRCASPLIQDERDTNGDLCHACAGERKPDESGRDEVFP